MCQMPMDLAMAKEKAITIKPSTFTEVEKTERRFHLQWPHARRPRLENYQTADYRILSPEKNVLTKMLMNGSSLMVPSRMAIS